MVLASSAAVFDRMWAIAVGRMPTPRVAKFAGRNMVRCESCDVGAICERAVRFSRGSAFDASGAPARGPRASDAA